MDPKDSDINISATYTHICRLCFKEGNLEEINERTLQCKFTPILMKIFEDAVKYRLPERTCVNCLEELKQIALFIKKCKHSQIILNHIEKKCERITMSHESKVNVLSIYQITPPIPDVDHKKCEFVSENVLNEESVNAELEKAEEIIVEHEVDEDIIEHEEVNNGFEEIEAFNTAEDINNVVQITSNEVDVIEKNIIEEVVNAPDEIISNIKEDRFEEIINENNSVESLVFAEEWKVDDLKMVEPWQMNFDTVSTKDIELQLPYYEITQDTEVKLIKKQTTCEKICQKCGMLINTLHEHYKISKQCQPRNYNCSQCNQSFISNWRLSLHMKARHWSENDQYFICHVCSKLFKYKVNLTRHLRSHEGIKPFQCGICDQGFAAKTAAEDHLNVHYGLKPFVCIYCNASFGSRAVHRVHQIQKHGHSNNGPSRKVFCNICNKQASCEETLIAHKLEEHSNPTFKCNTCEEEFPTKKLLNNHANIHKKPIFCTLCFKSFKSSTILSEHMKIHTGEKPFQCNVCGKKFTQRAHLYYHSALHKGLKPYSCTFCQKKFTLKGNLTVHTRIHTGEKPYVCHVCNQGFYDASGRKRHIIKKHGQEEVKCSEKAILNEA